ncbi:MAG TPA: hypothetical protein DCL95_01360 [Rhodospirillaceae bacterium]|nr:hypothetical protein [Rhodospirillaceae bacterium]MAX63207.1 hypothetical protein [Rhodospirillaceae bacterium]MBB59449.1 hypothetical protein [Rhodospirillaceae bacterium]HAE02826.1 hypothetical protein [Rhodospirillaceae bacterium]HAJ18706.1 hypothetical protein [Rhodospirillaceae bacterium]|tara:strand:+ start:34798 stop:35055 length:258 start_codon:yes stop_codon:yes gene_type:complete
MMPPVPLVHIADAILLIIAAEALFLIYRAKNKGPTVARFLPNLISGAFLVLALRLALGEVHWLALLACLAGSFAAHLYDLWRMHR